MRRRLRAFFPIVLVALLVQIFAPIGACWATSRALSDPLGAAAICAALGGPASGQTDQTGGHHAHDGSCSACCVTHTGAPGADTPKIVLAIPYRHFERVVWCNNAPDVVGSRAGSNAQARAPPQAA
jgi:hypothetical protein